MMKGKVTRSIGARATALPIERRFPGVAMQLARDDRGEQCLWNENSDPDYITCITKHFR